MFIYTFNIYPNLKYIHHMVNNKEFIYLGNLEDLIHHLQGP